MTKQPLVTLFTHTKDPLKAIALAAHVWHNPIPGTAEGMNWSEEELIEKFEFVRKAAHTTPFEYFSLVFVLENCSRGFQQQLTRHRVGFSYSIQSLRVVNPGNFASEGRYHCPESVKDKVRYHDFMLDIQNDYAELISKGEITEDARGILPLNIHSTITLCTNYRALLGLARQRMCHCAQGEFQIVIRLMKEAVEKIHPIFGRGFDCSCNRFTKGRGVCKTDGKTMTDKD